MGGFSAEPWLVVVVLGPLVGALLNAALGARLPGRLVHAIALCAIAVSFVSSILVALALRERDTLITISTHTWMHVGSLDIGFGLTADKPGAVMLFLVSGVGLIVHVLSMRLMSREPMDHRYFASLALACAAMLFVVLGDSLPVIFLGWQSINLSTYLLTSLPFSNAHSAIAAHRAFILNRVGDLGIVVAMVLLFRFVGSLEISQIEEAVATGRVSDELVNAVGLLIFSGAACRSAQMPFFVWLSEAAMAPVAGLAMIAVMASTGFLLVVKFGFLWPAALTATVVMASIGAMTAVFGVGMSMTQAQIKKRMAYATLSQLGLAFFVFSMGCWSGRLFREPATHTLFNVSAGSVVVICVLGLVQAAIVFAVARACLWKVRSGDNRMRVSTINPIDSRGLLSWFAARSARDWHIPALYDVLIIEPLEWLAQTVLFQTIERIIIDGAIGFVGRLFAGVGFVLQLFHNGNIQRYLVIFTVGVALLMLGWLAPLRLTPADIDAAPMFDSGRP